MSFDYDIEIDRLKQRIAANKQNSPRTKWLIEHIKAKFLNFPRDFMLRMRLSRYKRLKRLGRSAPKKHKTNKTLGQGPSMASVNMQSFHVTTPQKDRFRQIQETKPDAAAAMAEMISFLNGTEFDDLVEKARALDPNIGTPAKYLPGLFPPWHDMDYPGLTEAKARLPHTDYDTVILMPFCKLGGSDFVAGVLSQALSETSRVLILRTEQSDWERPDWFPDTVDSVDVSDCLDKIQNPARALYVLMQHITPRQIYNVNSRRCFEMYVDYGQRLAHQQIDLYAYYFCADRDQDGVEAGYPVMFMTNVLPHLKAALLDSRFLSEILSTRYAMAPETAGKLHTVYTPAVTDVPPEPVTLAQLASKTERARPKLIWAGRFDKQKRFDLLIAIAREMPDIDFAAWGKAVLDKPPVLKNLPSNLTLNAPFKSYDELPLETSDGWVYTSAWDGLPTILIECAAMGVPITASAVGGVPELIDTTTGWPVEDANSVQAYVTAIREMLNDDTDKLTRTRALQDRIRTRHAMETYKASIQTSQRGA